MVFKEQELEGLYEIEIQPIADNRGYFARIFCLNELKEIGLDCNVKQMNISSNEKKGVLRGMHFQYPPNSEIKIVQCIKGSIYDVVIDLRKNSKTFLEWRSFKLCASLHNALYIPRGFAHGFQTLEDETEVLYFHSENFAPENNGAIHYNDPRISINWPLSVSEISKNDSNIKFIDSKFSGVEV